MGRLSQNQLYDSRNLDIWREKTMITETEFLDVESLNHEDKERLEKCLFTYKPNPCFLFADKFLFTVSSKHPLDKTEKAIIESCFADCAKKLKAYWFYVGKT